MGPRHTARHTENINFHGENLSGNGVIFWGNFSRFEFFWVNFSRFEKGLASGVIDYRLFLWVLRQKPVYFGWSISQ